VLNLLQKLLQKALDLLALLGFSFQWDYFLPKMKQ
jgi:hypothetical protein